MRLDAEGPGERDDDADGNCGEPAGPLQVPTAFALFPADIWMPPRAEVSAGRHQGEALDGEESLGQLATEEPDALAADIVAFLQSIGAQ